MKLGKRIAHWRARSLLSQRKLADKFGIKAQSVSQWERGESFPSSKHLDALPKALGITAEQFWARVKAAS